MRSVRSCLLAVAAISAIAAYAPAAQADAIYSFVTTAAQGSVVVQNGFTNNGTGFTGLPLTLEFTDAGVLSGEVSGFETASFPAPMVTGLAGFVSLTTYMDGATLGSLYDTLSLDVTFGPTWNITSANIYFAGTDIDFDLTNNSVDVGSDGLLNCTALQGSGACTATGYFAQVPEPASLPMLLSGLVGLLGAARLRRAA